MTTVKNTEVLYQNYNSVAPLGLICMNGTQELGAKINSYLERWADRNGMPHDDYMIECQCPAFPVRRRQGTYQEPPSAATVSVYPCRRRKLQLASIKLFDQENCMSPDDHYHGSDDELSRRQAAKPHRINVIMPLLYGGRQHRRRLS